MTFSPFVPQTGREQFVYAKGYNHGFDYGLEVALSESEMLEFAASGTDTGALRADPPQAAPAHGARSAAPMSTGGCTSPPPVTAARGEVKVVGYDEELGYILAAREQPGPGWVAVAPISDDDYAALDDPFSEEFDDVADGLIGQAKDKINGQARNGGWCLELSTAEPTGGSYKKVSVTNAAPVTFTAPPAVGEWSAVIYDSRYKVDSDGECCAPDDEDEDCRPGCEACEDEKEEVAKAKADSEWPLATHAGHVVGLARAANVAERAGASREVMDALNLAGIAAVQALIDVERG